MAIQYPKVRQYTTLNDTLLDLKKQVRASYAFAKEFLPYGINTPRELFDYLKSITTYEPDPDKNEVLQRFQTLVGENNFHGTPGAGDCDCFTIAALASFHALGFKNPVIVLVGRNKKYPCHIYAGLEMPGHKYLPFDLTEGEIGHERYYPYKQIIAFGY